MDVNIQLNPNETSKIPFELDNRWVSIVLASSLLEELMWHNLPTFLHIKLSLPQFYNIICTKINNTEIHAAVVVFWISWFPLLTLFMLMCLHILSSLKFVDDPYNFKRTFLLQSAIFDTESVVLVVEVFHKLLMTFMNHLISCCQLK